VLRSAGFNDGSTSGFFADSGVWAATGGVLQVQAESKGGDAVSVFHVGDALPEARLGSLAVAPHREVLVGEQRIGEAEVRAAVRAATVPGPSTRQAATRPAWLRAAGQARCRTGASPKERAPPR